MTVFSDLVASARWVAWRNERRGKNAKPTKVPYGSDGKHAKADDPTTWADRDKAELCARAIVNGLGGGIGIQLGDLGADMHLGGVDLDSCLLDGELAPWAGAILAALDTYAEVSPSGTGLKAFFYIASEDVRALLDSIGVSSGQWGCRRDAPGGDARDHGPAVELYLARRYFAVTENRWPAAPERIRFLAPDDLERLAALIPPPKTASSTTKPAGGDTSRSAKAFAKGAALRRAGKSYEEMVEALRADPETAAWVREKGEAAGQRELYRIWDKGGNGDHRVSEDQLALTFTERHADELRFVAIWGSWLQWDDGVWVREKTLKAYDYARIVTREVPGANRSARTVAAVERLAQSDRTHAMHAEDFDTNDELFNTRRNPKNGN